jgi:hypothetical protein
MYCTGFCCYCSGSLNYTEFLAATIETIGFLAEEKLMEAFERFVSDLFLLMLCIHLKLVYYT